MSEKIVIIEDNAEVRENIREILESADYAVEAAENGKDGIQLVKQEQPDLVLCDIMMPVLDGYGVLKQLRTDKMIADTPFVFLTAKTAREDMSRGMELGADDYIMKPFTIAELLKRVKTRLEKRQEVLDRSKQRIEEETSSAGAPIKNELNEPLKTITGIGELIMTEHYSMQKSEVVEFVSLIHKAGLELKDLVGETLKFYEIEELKADPSKVEELKSKSRTNSKALLEKVTENEAAIYRRSKDLIVSFEEADAAIPEKYFTELAANLIDNAFKFSMNGSMIRVISGIEDGRLVITVSDEGIGMTEDEIKKIAPYRKFSGDQTKKGLGLGLTNAKQIVELFGGTFTINSNKGVGTLIRFRLPIAK